MRPAMCPYDRSVRHFSLQQRPRAHPPSKTKVPTARTATPTDDPRVRSLIASARFAFALSTVIRVGSLAESEVEPAGC